MPPPAQTALACPHLPDLVGNESEGGAPWPNLTPLLPPNLTPLPTTHWSIVGAKQERARQQRPESRGKQGRTGQLLGAGPLNPIDGPRAPRNSELACLFRLCNVSPPSLPRNQPAPNHSTFSSLVGCLCFHPSTCEKLGECHAASRGAQLVAAMARCRLLSWLFPGRMLAFSLVASSGEALGIVKSASNHHISRDLTQLAHQRHFTSKADLARSAIGLMPAAL